MPRKRYEVVAGYPAYRAGKLSSLRVNRIEKGADGRGFHVELEHLDTEQLGRIVQAELPLPILPAGLTASFFCAGKFDTSVGAKIPWEDAVGRVLMGEFAPNPDGDGHIAGFQPPTDKEAGHE